MGVNSLPKTVKVWEIVDSEFPGYEYLMSSCELTECVDNDKYNAVRLLIQLFRNRCIVLQLFKSGQLYHLH